MRGGERAHWWVVGILWGLYVWEWKALVPIEFDRYPNKARI